MVQNHEDQTAANIQVGATLSLGQNRRIIAQSWQHQLVMDVRKERGGEDSGPTPPECFVMALGGCIVNITRLIAQEHSIPVKDIKAEIAGDIDPSKAFGMATETRAGFSHLSVMLQINPFPAAGEWAILHRELRQRCPLCDNIGNPTSLEIRLARCNE